MKTFCASCKVSTLASIGQRVLHISQILGTNFEEPFTSPLKAPKVPGIKLKTTEVALTPFRKSLLFISVFILNLSSFKLSHNHDTTIFYFLNIFYLFYIINIGRKNAI